MHGAYVVCKRKRHREKPGPSDYTPVPSTNARSNYNTMPNEESDYKNPPFKK